MKKVFAPVIVIPCFNHGFFIGKLIKELRNFEIPVIIVNDGSDQETYVTLLELKKQYESLILLHHEYNQGKGVAVLTGIKEAKRQNFTHALQLDADGQHDITDIPKFIAMAKKSPHDLISGKPIYDESVPKSRLYSRYITHFWVWVETLSFNIKDSMCGYRIYPVAETMALIKKNRVGSYMDFDTEIMVKLYWEGVNTQFIETRVIYPPEGVSHFRLWKDNLLISWMHTRLFFGMLWRIPMLLRRKQKDYSNKE